MPYLHVHRFTWVSVVPFSLLKPKVSCVLYQLAFQLYVIYLLHHLWLISVLPFLIPVNQPVECTVDEGSKKGFYLHNVQWSQVLLPLMLLYFLAVTVLVKPASSLTHGSGSVIFWSTFRTTNHNKTQLRQWASKWDVRFKTEKRLSHHWSNHSTIAFLLNK